LSRKESADVMAWLKTKSLFLISMVLAMGLGTAGLSWSQKLDSKQLKNKLKEAEGSYSAEDYSKAEEILAHLSQSFPKDPRFSYFQLMIAKCEYHLENYGSAKNKFSEFIHKFPDSHYIPSCYFMLGNIGYLQGELSESARNFIQAYQLARTSQERELSQRSLEPLLEEWLSENDLEKLSETERDKRLAPLIFFWLGKRNVESKNYTKALEALSYYRENFPRGEDMGEVNLLFKEASTPTLPTVKVGVLASRNGDFSDYGTSFVNGIQLALLSYTPIEKKVELVVKDSGGDLRKVNSLCRELIEEDQVVCILGPMESESVVKAAEVAENDRVPLLTPAFSQRGLTSLGNFIFELFPSEARKGESMAEFVIRNQGFSDFVMLVPETGNNKTAALSFKQTAEKLGGKVLAVENYPVGTGDFSPYLERLKKAILGITSSSPQEESGSFFDLMPARVDGFFLLADSRAWYTILSGLVNLKIYTTIITMEWQRDPHFLDLAQSLNQKIIFTPDESLRAKEPPSSGTGTERDKFLKSYNGQYKQEPNYMAALGYDVMRLLLSLFEENATPEKVAAALTSTFDFQGVSGEIDFDSKRENAYIPIYQLEDGKIKRLR
jgi:branched-chain amino acid transport system substrate-binding protein